MPALALPLRSISIHRVLGVIASSVDRKTQEAEQEMLEFLPRPTETQCPKFVYFFRKVGYHIC
jgi:hypothetical protein